LFIAPLAGMVPAFATAPVLVIVGALMFKSVSRIKLTQIEDTIPAFLTLILIPFTFSITQGMFWGFISHVLLYLIAGRAREISNMMYALGLIAVIMLFVQH
jgi:AGZA family xanthine/uracil permease-like MFS transporter